jgi:diguanylate cyclase (GGDEF)-like protein/PAS domain S-box-containing protein
MSAAPFEPAHAPVLVLAHSNGGKKYAWASLFDKLGIHAFSAQSLAEAISILGECKKLGTPVGLAVLELDSLDDPNFKALGFLRQWHNESELPILTVASKLDSELERRLVHAGANHCFHLPLDDSYFLLRTQQAMRISARHWSLTQDKQNAERLLEQHRSAHATKDLWRLDLASRTLEFNENCQEFSGYKPADIGNALDVWLSLVHPLDIFRLSNSLSRTDWQSSPEEISFEFRLQTPSGAWRWILIRGRLERDELGHPVGLLGSHTDITQAKTTDSVTGLPNRFHFDDWLHQHCHKGQQSLSVFLFGLDRFHLIADSLGRAHADQLLRLLGERLRSLACSHEIFRPYTAAEGHTTVARVSSDEYALALVGGFAPEAPLKIAELAEAHLTKAIWLDGKDIFTSFSIGYACYPSNSHKPTEAKDVWRDAEIALHSAKAAGGARTVAFDNPMRDRVVEQMRLENDLNRAIENWEFEVYYQPKVALSQNRIIGFEALLRWRHPEQGIIPPSQFIALAEANGLIVPLGIRTIREACRTLRKWQDAYPQDPPLEMSVNLSVRQFRDTHLIEEIGNILRETGIRPSTLQCEVTESVLIEDPEEALHIVERLREMGVGLKIDDFGTGYSSLSYLHRLPFDSLKIDRSFITSMSQDHTAYEIVKAILSLADNLGLNVVAEGVEHRTQAEELRNMGCKYGQGYLFSPPLTAESAMRMLEAQQPASPRAADLVEIS